MLTSKLTKNELKTIFQMLINSNVINTTTIIFRLKIAWFVLSFLLITNTTLIYYNTNILAKLLLLLLIILITIVGTANFRKMVLNLMTWRFIIGKNKRNGFLFFIDDDSINATRIELKKRNVDFHELCSFNSNELDDYLFKKRNLSDPIKPYKYFVNLNDYYILIIFSLKRQIINKQPHYEIIPIKKTSDNLLILPTFDSVIEKLGDHIENIVNLSEENNSKFQ